MEWINYKAGDVVPYDDVGTGYVQIVSVNADDTITARRTLWLWGYSPRQFTERAEDFFRKVASATAPAVEAAAAQEAK